MSKTKQQESKQKGKAIYPAVCIVHYPSGPVPACEEHAKQLVGLAQFLGSHCVVTKLEVPTECPNCINENKTKL